MEGAHSTTASFEWSRELLRTTLLFTMLLFEVFFEESIDFIGAHYTLNSRSEPFWCQAGAQIKKSKRQLLYSEILKDGARPRVENVCSLFFLWTTLTGLNG